MNFSKFERVQRQSKLEEARKFELLELSFFFRYHFEDLLYLKNSRFSPSENHTERFTVSVVKLLEVPSYIIVQKLDTSVHCQIVKN